MGVKGLWKLIEGAGTPVPLESLEQKILAVDVSIWLHQAVHGFKALSGPAGANAHLLTLFHRICKLLFYRIKPVFVFDGGVPSLKKQTLSFRRIRREAAADRAQQVRQRLLKNLLKSHAVRNALGKTGPSPSDSKVLPPPKPVQKDMFELPPLPEDMTLDEDITVKTENCVKENTGGKKPVAVYQNIHEFDLESENFKSLPLQTRHEVLVELQDSRKDNSWATINQMPGDSNDFASFQMNRLLKRHKFQETIDGVRSTIQQVKSAELEREMFGDLEKHVSQTHKIASEDTAHSIVLTRKTAEEEGEKKATKEEKGKSLMKTKPKDFLTELVNKGVIEESDSDNDFECDLEKVKVEEENVDQDTLLEVMNYMMDEENGISQDEILTIIQQSSDEVDEINTFKSPAYAEPSTSANAAGVIARASESGSESDESDDDFIEVPLDEGIDPIPSTQESEASSHNIDAIRSSNSTSLFIKIVQHQLDDIIHKTEVSSNKALVDTRKSTLSKSPAKITTQEDHKGLQVKKAQCSKKEGCVSLTLDLASPKKVDKLFADIFQTPVTNVKKPVAKTATIPHKTSKKSEATTTELKKYSSVDSNKVAQLTEKDELQNKINALVKSQIESMLLNSGLNLPTASVSTEEMEASNEDIADSNKSGYSKNKTQTKQKIQSIATDNHPILISSESSLGPSTSSKSSLGASTSSKPSLGASTSSKPLLGAPTSKSSLGASTSSINKLTSGSNKPVSKIQIDSDGFEATSIPLNVKLADPLSPDKISSSVNLTSVLESSLEVSQSLVEDQKHIETRTQEPIKHVLKESSEMKDRNKSNINTVEPSIPSTDEAMQNNELESLNFNDPAPVLGIDELKEMESELVSEQQTLVAQANKVERVASNLSQQTYTDAQDLLQLFGLPFLVAPMEAEAQCAFLDEVGLTHGSVTDDSDSFLFGSKHVFKNFFNQNKHVEYFKAINIQNKYGLDREKLICLALITGSDYTVGIDGAGAVSGMEILSEFSGEGLEILKNFKKWWKSATRGVSAVSMSKIREKMVKMHLPEGFPSEEVFNAYIHPTVDESKEKFEWSVPNIEALREFAGEKFGWSRLKTDEILLPVMKRLKINSTQTRIDSYFHNVKLTKETNFQSKRLKDAIAKSRGESVPNETSVLKNIKEKLKKDVKRDSKKRKRSDGSNTPSEPARKSSRASKMNSASELEDEPEPVIMTREEKKLQNYKNLYKKEIIAQRKAEMEDMRSRKLKAAEILKKKTRGSKQKN